MKRLSLCLAVAALACNDGNRLLDPQPVAPQAFISVGVQHDSQTRRFVNASLLTGRAVDGYPVRALDSSMVVNGETIAPEVLRGGFYYSWAPAPTAPTGTPDSILALLPRMDIPDSDSLRVAVKVPARVGAYDVLLAPGEDLHLRVTPQSLLSLPANPHLAWYVDVATTCNNGQVLGHFTGAGSYPDSALFARSQLPNAAPFEACLFVSWYFTAATQPYFAGLFVSTRVLWRVRYAP